MNNKIFLIFLTLFFLIGGVFIFSLFSPRAITIESSGNFSSDNDTDLNLTSFSDDNDDENDYSYLKTISDLKNDLIAGEENFLEVNLSTMKVTLYQEGKIVKEVPILAKGDPQGWGGSASGLYKILGGNKLSFSGVAGVYMPYALSYYGKYYLHGEPYYPDGRKLLSSVSGGCIRLNNKDAKEIYELVEIGLPVLVIDKEKDNYYPSFDNSYAFPEVSAKSYLVADLDSGFVFAQKNSNEQLPIASLTKLMLAIVAAENIDLRKSILVQSEWLEKGYGSTKGLEAEKTFRIVELFYPLLIESSNDAAEVISHFLGREKTIKMMNEKAKAILMEKSVFVDPAGFELNNLSTAEDLFQLARYILNVRPPLLEISKGKTVASFGEISFKIEDLYNKNVFSTDLNFVGGKTGFLKQARYTAIFIFKFLTKEEKVRNIVIILLGSEDNKADTQKIYKWLEENYLLSPLFSSSRE
jgi:D-alanyl-D-alanine carboxypeptidase